MTGTTNPTELNMRRPIMRHKYNTSFRELRQTLINENHYETLLNRISDGFLSLDKDLCFTYVNKQVEKTTGKSAESLIGRYVWDIFPDAIGSDTYNAIQEAFIEQRYVTNTDYNAPLNLWQENHIYPSAGGLSIFVKDISDKKNAEMGLKRSEESLSAIFDNTTQAFILLDPDGTIKQFNKNAIKYGIDAYGKIIEVGTTVFDLIEEERISFFKEVIKDVLAGSTIQYSRSYDGGASKDVWYDFSVTPVYYSAKITGVCITGNDVTEKKRLEHEREFEQKNLESLINNTSDLMWSVDRDFNLLTANRPFTDMMFVIAGSAPVKGASMLSILPNEQANKYKAYYERAFTGEIFTELENSTVPYEHWSEISFYPIRKGDVIVGTACHSRDITKIKETERHLRKSEVFNRGVLDSLKAHLAVLNHTGKVVAVNDAWRRFSATSGETALQRTVAGSNYFDVCIKSANNGDMLSYEALQGMKDVLDGKRSVFHVEYSCLVHEEKRWFTMRVTKFESDKPMIVVAHIDITNVKTAREERDSTLRDLEFRVEERTKELAGKNKNILDSINYAKRIQEGSLCRPSQLTEIFPSSFILFKPLEIVSGDFFWCYQRRNKKFIVVADCTGHGVPGALMSIIGNNLLNHIIIDEHIENPSEILELLDSRLAEAVKGDTQEVKDGMDLTLCVVDTYFNEIYFAGAYNSLFISDENGVIKELAATRHAIGGGMQDTKKKFETSRFPITPGGRIYLSTDGFCSQFGGVKGKKFTKSRFINTLETLQNHAIDEHKKLLQNELTEWTSGNEQVDDIMVIGIEF